MGDMSGEEFMAWIDIKEETFDALIALDTPARVKVCEISKKHEHLPLNDAFKAALAEEESAHAK